MTLFAQLVESETQCTTCGTIDVQACAAHREVRNLLAEDIARDVLDHIDTMYPTMWHGVPKTARTSVRNTIINRVIAALTL